MRLCRHGRHLWIYVRTTLPAIAEMSFILALAKRPVHTDATTWGGSHNAAGCQSAQKAHNMFVGRNCDFPESNEDAHVPHNHCPVRPH